MPVAHRRSPFAFVALMAVAIGLIGAIGLLGALPAVLAFALLFCGRYPGAAGLERLIAARRPRAARPAARSSAPARRGFAAVSRGGGLIASSLAKRPPPALLAST